MRDSLGLRARVTLAGTLDHEELLRQYAIHDVRVVPSFELKPRSKVPFSAVLNTVTGRKALPPESEGTPRVLLEAMAAGLVPVASSTGGIPDVIVHESNGLFFPPGSVAQLAANIRRLSEDRSLLSRLSARAAEDSLSISMDRLLAMWDC